MAIPRHNFPSSITPAFPLTSGWSVRTGGTIPATTAIKGAYMPGNEKRKNLPEEPDTSRFQEKILDFYHKNGRHDLPWRKTTDPYLILVSEIMLQQTQVARVIVKISPVYFCVS